MQYEFAHIGGSDQPVSSNDLTELQLRIEHALAFSKSGTVAVDARWLSILLDKIAALEDPLSKAEAAEDRLWDLHREVKKLPFAAARKALAAAFEECDKGCESHRLDLCEHGMMPRYVPVSPELRKMWNEDRPHFMGQDRVGSPHRYDGFSESAECVYCCRPKNYVPRKRAARARK